MENLNEILIDANFSYDSEGNKVFALQSAGEAEKHRLTRGEVNALINKFARMGSLSYYGAVEKLKLIANGKL